MEFIPTSATLLPLNSPTKKVPSGLYLINTVSKISEPGERNT